MEVTHLFIFFTKVGKIELYDLVEEVLREIG
jgi:hypothetical protein